MQGNMDTNLKKISTYESSFIEAESAEFMAGLESLSSKDQLLVQMKFAEFLNRKIMHVAAEGKVEERERMSQPSVEPFVKRACENIGYHIGQSVKGLGFAHCAPLPDGGMFISAAVAVYKPNFNNFKQYKYSEDPLHQKAGIIKEAP